MGDDLGSPARRRWLAAIGAGGLAMAGSVFSNIRIASAQTLYGVSQEGRKAQIRVPVPGWREDRRPEPGIWDSAPSGGRSRCLAPDAYPAARKH